MYRNILDDSEEYTQLVTKYHDTKTGLDVKSRFRDQERDEMTHTNNLINWEAEVGEILQVWGQPEIHTEFQVTLGFGACEVGRELRTQILI